MIKANYHLYSYTYLIYSIINKIQGGNELNLKMELF